MDKLKKFSVKTFLIRTLCMILITAVLLCGILYGVMFILCKGPSPYAAQLFVLSVRETSAIGFLADMFFTPEEIAEIESRPRTLAAATDTSLIDMESSDTWGYTDDDGDGIILVPVAGINGGGFVDPGGKGNGSMPNSTTVMYGKMYATGKGVGPGFVGLDDKGILHVGINRSQDLIDKNIQHGTGYGPILVVNGEMQSDDELASGVNPRTAIGQRSDGAILMLVINGREINSLGATYKDEAEIMIEFGAITACNLDGGSSTLMYYNGEYVNDLASVIGVRDIPTSFLVLKEAVK